MFDVEKIKKVLSRFPNVDDTDIESDYIWVKMKVFENHKCFFEGVLEIDENRVYCGNITHPITKEMIVEIMETIDSDIVLLPYEISFYGKERLHLQLGGDRFMVVSTSKKSPYVQAYGTYTFEEMMGCLLTIVNNFDDWLRERR